jgi:hypothetical protein
MKYLLLLLPFVFNTAIGAENQSTICKHENQERKIEVVYPENMESICEVQYTKDTGMQILWNAKSEVSYCEEKAVAFVEKQRGWGWQCDSLSSEMLEQAAY